VTPPSTRARGRFPPPPERAPALSRPPASTLASDLLARLAPPVLAVHAGAGSRAKRWDTAGFVQVANWWRSAGGTALTVAGPAEAGETPMLGPPEARDWPL